MENLVPMMDSLPVVLAIVLVSVGGWVFTTWLRVKHGYPLENSSGETVQPLNDRQAMERIKLLSNENAQLKAEIGAMKDRLETVERIVTDKPSKLAREIDSLALSEQGNA